MSKITFAIKLDKSIVDRLKKFCSEHGTKYSFFVEKAIEKKLVEEDLKEDIIDLKNLKKEESEAIPFEEYLRRRDA